MTNMRFLCATNLHNRRIAVSQKFTAETEALGGDDFFLG